MALDDPANDLEASSEAVVELTYTLGECPANAGSEAPPELRATNATDDASPEEAEQRGTDLNSRFKMYLSKFGGVEGKFPPSHCTLEHSFSSALISFLSILLVSIIDYYFLSVRFEVNDYDVVMLSGAQAASAVLLYEAYQSPLAQPRNVIGSYTVCSTVGVAMRIVFGDMLGMKQFILGGLTVGVSILFMNLTKTVHPPGGACALLAIIGSENLKAMGFGYVLTSMGAAFVMVAVAVLFNNLCTTRQYPLYWN